MGSNGTDAEILTSYCQSGGGCTEFGQFGDCDIWMGLMLSKTSEQLTWVGVNHSTIECTAKNPLEGTS